MEKSRIYKLHPLCLFLYLMSVIVLSMINRHPVFIVLSFVSSLIYGIFLTGKKIIKYSFFSGLIFLFFTTIVMPLFYHNGVTPIFYINDMAITLESIVYGLMMTLLLLSVMQWFVIWNYHLEEDKILYLLGRTFPSISLMLSMALRFVPLLIERYIEIRDCMLGMEDKSRLNKGKFGLIYNIKRFIRNISILLSFSLEESMETSIAMESRGYGLKRRSNFFLFKFKKRYLLEIIFIIFVFIWLLTVLFNGNLSGMALGKNDIVVSKFYANYFPIISFSKLKGRILLAFIGEIIFFNLPIIVDVIFFVWNSYRGKFLQDYEEAEREKIKRDYCQ